LRLLNKNKKEVWVQTVPLKQICSILFLCVSLWLLSANAVFRSTIDYQGYLSSESGEPLEGSVDIQFALYDIDAGGDPLWTDTRLIAVRQGLFSVELGGIEKPFPAGLFETPFWLGLKVAGRGEMVPRKPISSTGFSFKVREAEIRNERATPLRN
jgi:hypothetical protein